MAVLEGGKFLPFSVWISIYRIWRQWKGSMCSALQCEGFFVWITQSDSAWLFQVICEAYYYIPGWYLRGTAERWAHRGAGRNWSRWGQIPGSISATLKCFRYKTGRDSSSRGREIKIALRALFIYRRTEEESGDYKRFEEGKSIWLSGFFWCVSSFQLLFFFFFVRCIVTW